MAKPILTFRVHPESRRGHYFDVSIWRTLAEMRAAVHRRVGERASDAHAVTICAEYRAKGRRLPKCGELHFAARHCQPWAVAHEVAHAGLYWAARIGLDASSDGPDEERLCYAQGRMNQAIVDRLARD